jgi:hypothetical protein
MPAFTSWTCCFLACGSGGNASALLTAETHFHRVANLSPTSDNDQSPGWGRALSARSLEVFSELSMSGRFQGARSLHGGAVLVVFWRKDDAVDGVAAEVAGGRAINEGEGEVRVRKLRASGEADP